jgi:hypothetical protein
MVALIITCHRSSISHHMITYIILLDLPRMVIDWEIGAKGC